MYSMSIKSSSSFNKTVDEVRTVLQTEGFGVLTEIDVKETLKNKLDVDFDRYIILGACNPPLAFKALSAEKEIGLMLPCNVIVYESDGTVNVSAIDPVQTMSTVNNRTLTEIAEEVREKLKRVIGKVKADT
ncbi:MAG: DUF302 domain-containing protein [archaeon]